MPEKDEHPLLERLAAARERQRRRPWPLRVLIVLAGFTVLAAGLAMLALPGPAVAVIPLGLFLLALEFLWAERALGHVLVQASKAKQLAGSSTRRRLAAAAGLLAGAGAAGWLMLYGPLAG